MKKVSVIVPIYNVENYIQKCLISIVNQTYKNLEIILVDDGSTDNSGEIAKGYSRTDERIKYYCKENGGLSDARNFGMSKVGGEYVLFVDSDDWLDVDMIRTMVKKIEEHNGDIVQSNFYYAYEDHILYDDRYDHEEDLILDNKHLMKELVKNEMVKNFAWGKLYKIDLVKDILFEKGVRFEDVFWAHQVMSRADKYIILNQPMVYYLQRSNSISGSYRIENTDIIRGLLERHKFIKENYSHLQNESNKLILKTCLMHHDMLLKLNDEKASEYAKSIEKYIDKNYKELKESVKNDKNINQELKYFKINPSLRKVYVIYNKILMKLKIKKSEPGLKRIENYESTC